MLATQPHRRRRRAPDFPGFKVIIWSGLAITLILPLLSLLTPAMVASFNGKIYDTLLMGAAKAGPSERILIVDIDESSLRKHGQWPWPRYTIAAILDKLEQSGAAAIVLDMMFPESDRTSLALIQQDLARDLNVSLDLAGGAPWPDNDRVLAAAIADTPTVLGYQFILDADSGRRDCRLHPLLLPTDGSMLKDQEFGWTATGAICSLDLLTEQTQFSGFFNVAPDADGVVRSIPLVMRFGDHFYPHLALAAVLSIQDSAQPVLLQRFDAIALDLGPVTVPLNRKGGMLINFRGQAGTYPYVSAADLLGGRIDPGRIAGKIVFVGTSAAGLNELRATPFDPLLPGVEIHATVADNLLSGDFIHRPAAAGTIEFFAAILCGAAYVFATARARAARGLLLIAASAAVFVWCSYALFASRGIFFSPLLPLLVLTGNFALLNLLKFWREELKSRQQTHDLALAQAAIIESMASLTEKRDPETGGHIKRTQEYVRLLAEALRKHPAYSPVLDDKTIDLLYKSAPLHDIGKVGVSDRILLKAGELSAEESEEMKRHAVIGRDVIAAIQERLGSRSFLSIAHEITFTHHEKWDGSGYPQGLRGEEIPLSGRLMAIVDMYDALTSRRVYKKALSHEEAIEMMCREARSSFDPLIFKTFLSICGEFRQVALKLADPPEPTTPEPGQPCRCQATGFD